MSGKAAAEKEGKKNSWSPHTGAAVVDNMLGPIGRRDEG